MFSLPDTCTWWRSGGVDNYGQPIFEAPTTIACHWEYRTELQISAKGKEFYSVARVFLPYDGPKVNEGDFLAKGDHTGVTDPVALDDARDVKQKRVIGSLVGTGGEFRVIV